MLWLKSDMKHFGSSTGTSDSCLQIVRIVAIRLECQERQCLKHPKAAREKNHARVGSTSEFYIVFTTSTDIQPSRSNFQLFLGGEVTL
jgi:hypothetical protein